ncbi:hypothetical protein DPMN_011496 [Dreissena polymorpha]|uniref:Uncharacterized protein n=1 Tax=Dreissena polymorpha TaxID=45954 RepID=A0A9D4N566_DREPO|nr:hypothetical protein DPMN_011496 [Dreissena polymorpha]
MQADYFGPKSFNLWQNFIGTNVLTKFHEDWPINVANIDNCPPPPGGHVFQQTITIFKLTQDIVRTNVQIKFHKDWIINVTSRVLTRKNATPPCGHVSNILTKFHEHWTTNVTTRVLTRKTAPPHGGHVFHSTGTIFELFQDIIGTHVLTKFHEDWTKNVTSRVLTRKTATPPGGHVFQPTGTIFEFVQYIIGTHVLTKFHEDWTKNVTSRVLTRKTATPPGGHVFQPTGTIFELVQYIIGTHVLTKFHEDRTINVTSRVLTRFAIYKTATPPGGHVVQSTGTIFELVQDIIGTHVLSKFHEDWTINMASRVHDGQKAITIAHHEHRPCFFTDPNYFQTQTSYPENTCSNQISCEHWTKNVTSRGFTCFHYIHIEKTAPPPGGHVFSPIWTIFELVRDINETSVLTKFHDDWAKIETSRVFTRNTASPPGGHLHEDLASNVTSTVFTSFELSQGINETNVMTKFHEDQTINVASRVFTRQNGRRRCTTDKRRSQKLTMSTLCSSELRGPPHPVDHVFLLIRTIFELDCHIHETNVLTKFHEDWAKNVSSRMFTCFHFIHIKKTAPPPGGHVFQKIMTIFELLRDIHKTNETNVLTIFYEYWAKNVSSRLITCFHYIQIEKIVSPPGGHVFPLIISIFKLTKFQDDKTKNVTSRVFTSFFNYINIRKMTPPLGGHVFLPIRTIFYLNCRIQETNVLNKFHEDWTKNVTSIVFTCFHYKHEGKTAPPPGGHVFSPIWTIFELIRDINKTNVLTKFHGDWAKIVTSIVLTRNTAQPPGGHVFQRTGTIFEHNQHIIKTNILTKLHEDWASNVTSTVFTSFELNTTRNVASRVFTRQNVDIAQRTKGDRKSSP